VLFFGLAAVFRVLRSVLRERRLRPHLSELVWVGLFAALFVPYFAWRWHFYGWLFPNTFYVKSSGSAGTWKLGSYYLRRFAEDYGVHFLLLLAFLGRAGKWDRPRRDLRALAFLVWGVFAAYTMKVGGDFMGLYRFILPVLPLGAVVLQESLRNLYLRLRPLLGAPTLLLALAVLATGFLVGSAHTTRVATTFVGADNGIDTPAYLKHYAEERISPAQWLAKYKRPGELMTVGGAGVIPYYSEIPAYDVFGLVDAKIAHDPHMTVSSRPGHQKWGSDEYMLSRKPTLITHHYCLGKSCTVENGWTPPGFEWVRANIKAPDGSPSFYSFLKRRDRTLGPFPAH
jgi:hypothetical protein